MDHENGLIERVNRLLSNYRPVEKAVQKHGLQIGPMKFKVSPGVDSVTILNATMGLRSGPEKIPPSAHWQGMGLIIEDVQ